MGVARGTSGILKVGRDLAYTSADRASSRITTYQNSGDLGRCTSAHGTAQAAPLLRHASEEDPLSLVIGRHPLCR